MTTFVATLFIECNTLDQAQTVVAERITYDEQYDDDNGNLFDYTIAASPVSRVGEAIVTGASREVVRYYERRTT